MVTRFVDFTIRLLDKGISAQSVSDRPNGNIASISDIGACTYGGLRPQGRDASVPGGGR